MMTRFNTATKGKNTSPAKAPVVNYEGASAYPLNAKEELYSLAVTNMLQDKFYAKADSELARLKSLVRAVPHDFTAKLAVYCREQMWLRSIPVVLLTELTQVHHGDDLVRRTCRRVIKRVDEISETLSYYALINPRMGAKKLNKLSAQLKLGLADAFSRFNEYQFSKYDGSGKEVSLRDALFLCHPKPVDEDAITLYQKIASGTLGTAYTWESELSSKGNKKEVWEELLDSGKVGYMALLRNLRNILNAGVSDTHIKAVAARLGDEKEALGSHQFPFRFFSAWRELSEMSGLKFDRRVSAALEQAMTHSVANINGIAPDDRAMLICDMSGSMGSHLGKSKVQLFEIGVVMASLLNSYLNNPKLGMFADSWKLVNIPQGGVLANTEKLSKEFGTLGGSTNGWKALDFLIKNKVEFDKVIFFTDCQWWDSTDGWGDPIPSKTPAKLWAQYHALFPQAKGYYIDLAGYGTTPVKIDKATGMSFVAGWNERVFEMIERIENGSTAVQEIDKIVL